VLTSDGVRSLVESKHLRLNHLDVRGNGLRPADIAALRQRFPDVTC
jgi:hypothetical protein